MRLNNGEIFNYNKWGVLTELSKCTYFFRSEAHENTLLCKVGNRNVLSYFLNEKNDKHDLIIKFPDNFECCHHYKGNITDKTFSNSNSHLTYHGTRKGKKETGEIHILVSEGNPLKGRSNVLEAPLAKSDNLSKFPLPICRWEFSDCINPIDITRKIYPHFETIGKTCFFNTQDVYLAKKGFIEDSLRGKSSVPEIVLSIFSYFNLQVFQRGELTRRRGNYPQVIVLQTKSYELIIININESQNQHYKKNTLHYFHSVNYMEQLFNRMAMSTGKGYFVSKSPENNDHQDFFKVIDLI